MSHCKDCRGYLQKIAVLETKIYHLEDNANNTTMPWSPKAKLTVAKPCSTTAAKLTLASPCSAKQRNTSTANGRLLSEAVVTLNEQTVSIASGNTLGAKPKNKSIPFKIEILETAEHASECPEINTATGWPALQFFASTPVADKEQPWIATKGRNNRNSPIPQTLQLDNRFQPLLHEPRSLPEDLAHSPSPRHSVRNEGCSKNTRPQQQQANDTRLKTLVVGDSTIKNINTGGKKNTKTYCFPDEMVCDITKKIPEILSAHQTVSKIIVHVGANDINKEQSETLKQDFVGLLKMLGSLNVEAYISGPLPSVRPGVNRFSRLLGLNTWLSTTCTLHEVNFIDNFNLFWERRYLFRENGYQLNSYGEKLFTSNLLYYLCHPTVLRPTTDDKRIKDSRKKTEVSPLPLLSDSCSAACDAKVSRDKEPVSLSPSKSQQLQSQPQDDHSREVSPLPDSCTAARDCEDDKELDHSHSPLPQSLSCHSSRSSSLFSLSSPASPHLGFTDKMEQLVNAGLKLTPRSFPHSILASPWLSPPIPPRSPSSILARPPLKPPRSPPLAPPPRLSPPPRSTLPPPQPVKRLAPQRPILVSGLPLEKTIST